MGSAASLQTLMGCAVSLQTLMGSAVRTIPCSHVPLCYEALAPLGMATITIILSVGPSAGKQ